MRQLGVLESETQARRLADYLLTVGVAAHAEPDGGGWAVWVRDENDVTRAREELQQFLATPLDSRYSTVQREADSIRREQHERRQQAQRNVVDVRREWRRGSLRRRPLVVAIMFLCGLVAVLSNFGSGSSDVVNALSFLDRERPAIGPVTPYDALADIRRGEVWRLITPIFLHFGLIHLIFNLLMFYELGSLLEDRLGTVRIGGLILVIALLSNGVQALMPPWDFLPTWLRGSTNFGGISGVVYGLLGFAWMRSHSDPQCGYRLRGDVMLFLVGFMIAGFLGLFESMLPMAHWAHVIGFAVGAIAGSIGSHDSPA